MPRSILLADDSVTIQQAVSMTFAAEDISVTVVGDGEEALAQAREIQPDLILADVSMPGLSGYQLCEQVRGDPGLKHIPVLLLGGGTPIDPSKAIAVGANGHMPKPFDSQKLIDQVKQILANPTGHQFADRTVFQCQVGERSAVASEMAIALGVKDVVNFRGGFTAWKEAGLPVETP